MIITNTELEVLLETAYNAIYGYWEPSLDLIFIDEHKLKEMNLDQDFILDYIISHEQKHSIYRLTTAIDDLYQVENRNIKYLFSELGNNFDEDILRRILFLNDSIRINYFLFIEPFLESITALYNLRYEEWKEITELSLKKNTPMNEFTIRIYNKLKWIESVGSYRLVEFVIWNVFNYPSKLEMGFPILKEMILDRFEKICHGIAQLDKEKPIKNRIKNGEDEEQIIRKVNSICNIENYDFILMEFKKQLTRDPERIISPRIEYMLKLKEPRFSDHKEYVYSSTLIGIIEEGNLTSIETLTEKYDKEIEIEKIFYIFLSYLERIILNKISSKDTSEIDCIYRQFLCKNKECDLNCICYVYIKKAEEKIKLLTECNESDIEVTWKKLKKFLKNVHNEKT